MARTKIEYAKDDVNYFNGFRNTVKLLNYQLQFLQQAIEEVPEDKIKDTVSAWRKNVDKDLDKISQDMYFDMKKMYGMSLRIAPDDSYYIHVDKEIGN